MTLTRTDATMRPMVLRSTLTSPFGRKVRIAAEALGVIGSLTLEPADTRDYDDSLMQQNPLGKMPCLLLPDGGSLFGSDIIIDYLGFLAGDTRLCPWSGEALYRALTRRETCNGVAEAALLMVYERRFRDPEQVSQIWLDHCAGKIWRGLKAIEAELPDPAHTDVISISLAAALGYLDWRQPVDWRAHHPKLVAWLEAFALNEPAWDATKA